MRNDQCLDKVTRMSEVDRFIFLFGGALTAFITFFLIFGSVRFKQLRKQPGDLVIAIAINDFILSVHWIVLAVQPTNINDQDFCRTLGGIGTFAGMTSFLYNVSFSIYLTSTLRNALKQDKIPQIAFHLANLIISGAVLFLIRNFLGKTLVGTCSIKSACSVDIVSYLGPFIALLYCVLGIFTYLYVRRNAPICAKVHEQRTQFLNYYLRYNIMCSLIYFLIASTHILVNTVVIPQKLKTGRSDYIWINSLYNIAKLCSPLVLSIIRFNDPQIKKFWIKTFCCSSKKSHTTKNDLAQPLKEDEEDPRKQLEDGRETTNNEFVLNELSKTKRIQLVYTFLSCVLYNNQFPRTIRRRSSTTRTANDNDNEPYKHNQVFLIEDKDIKADVPNAKEELEQKGFSILPGSLKVYSPEIFRKIADRDEEFLDIAKSLDFKSNEEQIRASTAPQGGKSGEFFFFSKDNKLILKTVPDTEMNMIRKILQPLHQHLDQNSDSLIAKIYGVYTYQNTDLGLKFNFVLMKNICGFPSTFVERAYDMKGSRHDRQVLQGKEIINQEELKGLTLKDLDFEKYEQKLYIRPELRRKFVDQIKRDSEFFRSVNLIDYSLMVFIVSKQEAEKEIDKNQDFTAFNQLGSIESMEEPGLYYNMGIIDYFQPFNLKKRVERCLKRAKKCNGKLETSSQDPDYYSHRFTKFIMKLVEPNLSFTINKPKFNDSALTMNI